MAENIKKDLWNIICVVWAMVIALFWFSMRVIWSGITKVLFETMGKSIFCAVAGTASSRDSYLRRKGVLIMSGIFKFGQVCVFFKE